MNSKIKYSKDMKFLDIFVASVKDLVPLNKVAKIRSYRVRKDLEPKMEASVIEDKGKYSINIRAYGYDEKTKEYVNILLIQVLDNFSHELAHVVHWEHTYKHYELQGKIICRFAKVLKKLGVIDTNIKFNNLDTTKTFKEKKIEKK